MIRVLTVSCFALMLCTQQSAAQSRVDPAAQEVGAAVKWANRLGTRTLIYQGPDDGHFRYEMKIKVRGPEQVIMMWRDSDARLVRMEYGDVEQLYEPHDCRMTVGRCEYTYTNFHKKRDERTEHQYVVTASFSDGVWSYKKYIHSESPENLRREGTYSVDEFGIKIEGQFTFYRKGSTKARKGWTKRIPMAKR